LLLGCILAEGKSWCL